MYQEFWSNILKEFFDQLDPQKDFEFKRDISEIDEIGNRKEYNGYLEHWAGNVNKCTDSAVFRNLREAIHGFPKIRKSVFGYTEFRIKSNSQLVIQYKPLSYPTILWWYQTRVIPQERFPDEKYKWELVKVFYS